MEHASERLAKAKADMQALCDASPLDLSAKEKSNVLNCASRYRILSASMRYNALRIKKLDADNIPATLGERRILSIELASDIGECNGIKNAIERTLGYKPNWASLVTTQAKHVDEHV